MKHDSLRPPGWPRGKGYAHGMRAEGRFVFVAGQIGWDESEKLVSADFVDQLRRALENTRSVLTAGGATPEDVVRMTWYIVDKREYLSRVKEVGDAYRAVMGKNFPAMAVLEVKGLIEDGAKIEIETTAVIADSTTI